MPELIPFCVSALCAVLALVNVPLLVVKPSAAEQRLWRRLRVQRVRRWLTRARGARELRLDSQTAAVAKRNIDGTWCSRSSFIPALGPYLQFFLYVLRRDFAGAKMTLLGESVSSPRQERKGTGLPRPLKTRTLCGTLCGSFSHFSRRKTERAGSGPFSLLQVGRPTALEPTTSGVTGPEG